MMMSLQAISRTKYKKENRKNENEREQSIMS